MDDQVLEGLDIAIRRLFNEDIGASPRLPLDIVPQIVQHLRGKDAYAALRVCRAWYDIALPALYHTVDYFDGKTKISPSVNSAFPLRPSRRQPLDLVKVAHFGSWRWDRLEYMAELMNKAKSLRTFRLHPSLSTVQYSLHYTVRCPETMVCDNFRCETVGNTQYAFHKSHVKRIIYLINPKDILDFRLLSRRPLFDDLSSHQHEVVIFNIRESIADGAIAPGRRTDQLLCRLINAIADIALTARGMIDIVGLEILRTGFPHSWADLPKTDSDAVNAFEHSIRRHLTRLWRDSDRRRSDPQFGGRVIDLDRGLDERQSMLRFMTIRQYIQTDWRSDELDEEELLSWAPPRKDKERGDE